MKRSPDWDLLLVLEWSHFRRAVTALLMVSSVMRGLAMAEFLPNLERGLGFVGQKVQNPKREKEKRVAGSNEKMF